MNPSPPVRLLTSLAQALSATALYAPGHPMRSRAVAACHERLRELQQRDARPLFTFLDLDVLFGTQQLHELRDWQWAARFSGSGVRRLEFDGAVSLGDMAEVLEQLVGRLGLTAVVGAGGRGARDGDGASSSGTIRYGAVVVRDDELASAANAGDAVRLDEELAVVRWLYDRAATERVIAGREAMAVVQSVALVRQRGAPFAVPLVQLDAFEDYLPMHAVNVASMCLALADTLGMSRTMAIGAGVAGLLHDVGMACVPADLTARIKLTTSERAIVEGHVRIGAAMILRSAPELELAAVAAYEHHLRPDGSGYPSLAIARRPHPVSALVRICTVYHAVTTSRFHWPAWPGEVALRYLEERVDTEYDGPMVAAFAALMRARGPRIVPSRGTGDAGGAASAGPREPVRAAG